MSLPLDTSTRAKTVRRAKVLGELLLPIVILAAVAGAGFHRSPPTVNEARQESDMLSMTSTGASVQVTQELIEMPGKGATTVTTYTVMGTF